MAKEKTTVSKTYGEESIKRLSDLQAVRENPNVYLGTSGIEGCRQAAFEIISNSVDEAREGYGDTVNVTLFADGSVEVDDYGRGVPLGYNEKEKKYNWELVFCTLNAGGKYNRNTSEGVYKFSLGTHGIGACATQFTSAYMEVRSYRNGMCSEIFFKSGKAKGKLNERPIEKGERKSGTVIKWMPDINVFTDTNLTPDYFQSILRRQAVVNTGIKFVFKHETEKGKFEKVEYLYSEGITDYIKELAGDSAKTDIVHWTAETSGKDREDKQEYDLKMEMAFCCSQDVNIIEYYHNSSHLSHGGSPAKAVTTAFVSCFDKYIKNTGKYKKDESKISFSDIEASVVLVTNCFSTAGSFEHQTKSAINNAFIQSAMTEWIKTNLEIYFTEKPYEADIIANSILVNKRSRETVNKEILDIKKSLSKMMDTSSKVEKFVGCRSKDKEIRELYIVEGDSALGSCKHARNGEFQAVIPVRGKTLNCIKSTYDKIFDSDIIMDLLRVVGCGVEITHKKMKDLQNFNLDNLKWSKIIICTDADEDGFQIRALILTMFHTLLPTLIREGKVYIVESPLYEIIVKDESLYAYDEREKDEIIAGLGNAKYIVQRSKGLGENTAEMMAKTTMNPSTRRLIKVLPSDPEETDRMFDLLLGDALAERKKFIFENGHKYYNYADV
ncbi:MAG: DNA topoisomerase [Ruminococcaceae bacterium]|nr:DNA topoisomerase [Oscillospiraceae bacterium]